MWASFALGAHITPLRQEVLLTLSMTSAQRVRDGVMATRSVYNLKVIFGQFQCPPIQTTILLLVAHQIHQPTMIGYQHESPPIQEVGKMLNALKHSQTLKFLGTISCLCTMQLP